MVGVSPRILGAAEKYRCYLFIRSLEGIAAARASSSQTDFTRRVNSHSWPAQNRIILGVDVGVTAHDNKVRRQPYDEKLRERKTREGVLPITAPVSD